MGSILESRRSETKSRFEKLRKEVATAAKLADKKASVYLTGSFGREEASKYSDLDLFIVGREKWDDERKQMVRELTRLDEICLKADLIEATQRLKFPQFSGDGEYLDYHSMAELTDAVGRQEDDIKNTFTARLLLLLESKPLLDVEVYREAIESVVIKYWRDYEKHKNEFIPAFLANDILRLWRTFCVNYEARTQTEPERRRAKRKLKNYKLKHSRLLTCYSALLYLLAVYRAQKSVHPSDVMEMTGLTPTERLERLCLRQDLAEVHDAIGKLLEHYENFLEATNFTEDDLIERFLDPEKRKKFFPMENNLGDLMLVAIEQIGQRNPFHRVLVV